MQISQKARAALLIVHGDPRLMRGVPAVCEACLPASCRQLRVETWERCGDAGAFLDVQVTFQLPIASGTASQPRAVGGSDHRHPSHRPSIFSQQIYFMMLDRIAT